MMLLKANHIVPQPGAVLLHVDGDNCLVNEGRPVEGGMKYVLRTDLVYARYNQKKTKT